MPRSVVVRVGTPTAKLPVSTTRIVSARSSSAFWRHEFLQPAGPLLLRALADDLDAAREAAVDLAQRPQRGQVHDDVALAVRRTAPVPAPVALGQLPDRRGPIVLAERRLDVVVGIEQHRRRARRAGRVAVHRHAAIRGGRHRDVLQPHLGERVDHPLGGLLALLGRILLGVGHRPERHQLGQVLPGAAHQAPDGLAQAVSRHSGSRGRHHRLDRVVVLQVVDLVLVLIQLVGAVGVQDQRPRPARCPGRRLSAGGRRSRRRWSAGRRGSPSPARSRGSRRPPRRRRPAT